MVHKTLIMGIDPGANGGIAVYDPATNSLIDVITMPASKSIRSHTMQPDPEGIAHYIWAWQQKVKFAVIEDVAAMPDQGVVSMFNFGKGYGVLLGVLAANKIPVYAVKSSVWKMAMRLSRNKSDSIAMARREFDNKGIYFRHQKDDGRAEAALLASFGKRFEGVVR